MKNDDESRPDGPALERPIYLTYAEDRESKIDLVALARVFWSRKWPIAAVTVLFTGIGVAYAFLATPMYRAEAIVIPNEAEQVPSLPVGIGGLASMAGLDLGVSTDRTEAIATLRSRVFTESFIQDNDLLPILFAEQWDDSRKSWMDDDPDNWPDIRDGVRFFIEEVLTVEEDLTSGLVTLAVTWPDPDAAANWTDDLLQRINERLRSRDLSASERRLAYLNAQLESANLVELRVAISRLIENEIQIMTLARAETEYAFKIIDPPRVPDEPESPKKVPIIILAWLFGGIVGTLFALLKRWPQFGHSPASEKKQAR